MFYNIKKAFNAVCESALNVFAHIMRVCFPTFTVKSLTLKSRDDAWRYLPGAEKELKAIKNLSLTDEDIKSRLWSPETRLQLIRDGNQAIIADIRTDAEFTEVIKSQHNVGSITMAMKSYTPSKTRLRAMLDSFEKELMLKLICELPSAFSSLQAWEVLGVTEKQPYYGEDRWDYAKALIDRDPAGVTKFMDEVMKIPPQRLNEAAKETMKRCFEAWYIHNVDVSKFLPYMYVFWPDFYREVRQRCEKSSGKVGSYVAVILPQLVGHLNDAPQAPKEDELSNCKESHAWLRIAMSHLDEPEVMDCILDNFYSIEQSLKDNRRENFYQDVYRRLVSAKLLAKALPLFPESWKQKLAHALLDAGALGFELRPFFPFAGWVEKDTKKAVKILAREQNLPLNRLNELSVELRSYALDEMEIASELKAIDGGGKVSLEELVKVKLHPEAESRLLSESYNYLKHKFSYLENFELSEEGFKALVDARGYYSDSTEQYSDMIIAYAQKHGLSEKMYQMLMASRHAGLAPQLKQYLKNEAAEGPDFEAGV